MTTTDDFTEAARAEAERRTPLGGHTAPALTQERAGLVAMAEWARAHLAAQGWNPPETGGDQVE